MLPDRLTPTIRRHLVAKLPELFARARKGAARELRRHREPDAAAALPEACPYALDQLLDEDWYPTNRHGLADE